MILPEKIILNFPTFSVSKHINTPWVNGVIEYKKWYFVSEIVLTLKKKNVLVIEKIRD